jgi:hypothetical protein
MKSIKKSKKAQEESMGFVIIIMILIVVAVVFIGFAMRKPSSTTLKQQELADLTWAVLSYTTNCSISGESRDIYNLAKDCDRHPGWACDPREDETGGKPVCDYLRSSLNDTFFRLLGENLSLTNKQVHAYQFSLEMYEPRNDILIEYGNMSYGSYIKYLTFIPGNKADINVSTKFYFD